MSTLPAGQQSTGLHRTWGQRLVLLFNVALISICLVAAGGLSYAGRRAAAVNRVALDRSLTELTDDKAGERVVNILLVGSDSSANLDPDDPIQVGRQGERLGDVIIIAHLDERSGNVALLSLPRDLWVPIAGTGRSDRINRSFVVGGPAVLIETIEDTFDIPIHHYINVDFAGFQGLVEAVGSVEIYFETPARDWNVNAEPAPRSQTGFLVTEAGCQSLPPEQALAYVRSRYYQTQDADGVWHTDPTSDLGRIRRQQDFLESLLQKSIELGARNPLVLADLVDTGISNVAIDQELTPSLLIDLSSTYRSFEPGDLQTYTFPASDSTVGSNKVLVPRHDDAEALVALFGGERFDSPDTIAIELVHGPDVDRADETDRDVRGRDGERRRVSTEPTQLEVISDLLDQADFDFDASTESDLEPGISIRYGPGADQAANFVAETLATHLDPAGTGSVLRFEETQSLAGRNIEVVVGPTAPAGPSIDLADRLRPPFAALPEPDRRSGSVIEEALPGQSSPAAPSLDRGVQNGPLGQVLAGEDNCG